MSGMGGPSSSSRHTGHGHTRNVSSGSGSGSGSVGSIARMDHPYARSPLISPAEADDDDDGDLPLQQLDLSMDGVAGKTPEGSSPVVRTPVDRLPSPPLTPVASKENMRRQSGKSSRPSPRGDTANNGVIGRENKNGSATDNTERRDKGGNGNGNGSGTGHGELSTWFDSTANSAPESVADAEDQEAEEEEEEGDIAFAQPSNPLAGLSLSSLNRDKDLPHRPNSSVPPLPTQQTSPTSPQSQTRVGATGGAMSPQPWEVVDPPLGNNGYDPTRDELQMRELRVRNQSLKSTASASGSRVVVKKYVRPRSYILFLNVNI